MTADGSAPLAPEVLQERSARLAAKSELRLAPARPVAATPDERLPVVAGRVRAALLPPAAKLERSAPERPVAATPDERLPVVTERVRAALLPPVAKLAQRLAPVRPVAATPDERLPVVTERVQAALLPPVAKLEKSGQRWAPARPVAATPDERLPVVVERGPAALLPQAAERVPEVCPRPAAGPDARQWEGAERRAASEQPPGASPAASEGPRRASRARRPGPVRGAMAWTLRAVSPDCRSKSRLVPPAVKRRLTEACQPEVGGESCSF